MTSNGFRHPLKACALVVAMVMAVSVPGSAGADTCVKRSEIPALETRLFQTELMVAALTCKRRKDYNSIIAKFGDQLATGGRSLKAIFWRLYGAKSEQRLNRFVTRLANEASLRSLRKPGYCDGAVALFDETLGLQSNTLTAFVARQPFKDQHGLAVCEDAKQISQAE